MTGPPVGPPLWHVCDAWAPTRPAGKDGGAPIAPPDGPPSQHEEDEALVAAPQRPPLPHEACAGMPSGQARDGEEVSHLVKSMERGKLPVGAVLPRPVMTGAAVRETRATFNLPLSKLREAH